MTAYDPNALTELDASVSPTVPLRRSARPAALLRSVLRNVSVFALLLAFALAPLALRLYLIVR
jgi:hypothetical protein